MKLLIVAVALLATACVGPASSSSLAPQDETTSSPVATPSDTVKPKRYKGGVFALGDSVMLGAKYCLSNRGMKVDAKVSRQFVDGISIIKARRSQLPDRIVMHLGTNGPFSTDSFKAMMKAIGKDTQVYWMTIALPKKYTFTNAQNSMIRKMVSRYDNAHLIDWAEIAARNPEWFYADGTHLKPDGCKGYAKAVEKTVRAPL